MDVNNSFDIFSFMSDFYVLFVGIIATKVECVGQFAPLLCIGCDISIFLGSFLDFGVRLFAIKKRIVRSVSGLRNENIVVSIKTGINSAMIFVSLKWDFLFFILRVPLLE